MLHNTNLNGNNYRFYWNKIIINGNILLSEKLFEGSKIRLQKFRYSMRRKYEI